MEYIDNPEEGEDFNQYEDDEEYIDELYEKDGPSFEFALASEILHMHEKKPLFFEEIWLLAERLAYLWPHGKYHKMYINIGWWHKFVESRGADFKRWGLTPISVAQSDALGCVYYTFRFCPI